MFKPQELGSQGSAQPRGLLVSHPQPEETASTLKPILRFLYDQMAEVASPSLKNEPQIASGLLFSKISHKRATQQQQAGTDVLHQSAFYHSEHQFIINTREQETPSSGATGNEQQPYFIHIKNQLNPTLSASAKSEPASNGVNESLQSLAAYSASSWLTLLFGLLILINLIVILGNILVILAVYATPKLRTVTNIFTVSLAIADLLLGVLVLPYAVMFEILDVWVFGRIWCRAWLVVDVWISTASILNLCAISVDRYVAVTRPVKYRSIMTARLAKSIVASVWVVSFLICCPPLWPQWEPTKPPSAGKSIINLIDTNSTTSASLQAAQDEDTRPSLIRYKRAAHNEQRHHQPNSQRPTLPGIDNLNIDNKTKRFHLHTSQVHVPIILHVLAGAANFTTGKVTFIGSMNGRLMNNNGDSPAIDLRGAPFSQLDLIHSDTGDIVNNDKLIQFQCSKADLHSGQGSYCCWARRPTMESDRQNEEQTATSSASIQGFRSAHGYIRHASTENDFTMTITSSLNRSAIELSTRPQATMTTLRIRIRLIHCYYDNDDVNNKNNNEPAASNMNHNGSSEQLNMNMKKKKKRSSSRFATAAALASAAGEENNDNNKANNEKNINKARNQNENDGMNSLKTNTNYASPSSPSSPATSDIILYNININNINGNNMKPNREASNSETLWRLVLGGAARSHIAPGSSSRRLSMADESGRTLQHNDTSTTKIMYVHNSGNNNHSIVVRGTTTTTRINNKSNDIGPANNNDKRNNNKSETVIQQSPMPPAPTTTNGFGYGNRTKREHQKGGYSAGRVSRDFLLLTVDLVPLIQLNGSKFQFQLGQESSDSGDRNNELIATSINNLNTVWIMYDSRSDGGSDGRAPMPMQMRLICMGPLATRRNQHSDPNTRNNSNQLKSLLIPKGGHFAKGAARPNDTKTTFSSPFHSHDSQFGDNQIGKRATIKLDLNGREPRARERPRAKRDAPDQSEEPLSSQESVAKSSNGNGNFYSRPEQEQTSASDPETETKKRTQTTNPTTKVGCALYDHKSYVIYSALGSFYIPMLIMIFFYYRIYLVASRAQKNMQRGYMTTKWPLSPNAHSKFGGRQSNNDNDNKMRCTKASLKQQNHRSDGCQAAAAELDNGGQNNYNESINSHNKPNSLEANLRSNSDSSNYRESSNHYDQSVSSTHNQINNNYPKSYERITLRIHKGQPTTMSNADHGGHHASHQTSELVKLANDFKSHNTRSLFSLEPSKSHQQLATRATNNNRNQDKSVEPLIQSMQHKLTAHLVNSAENQGQNQNQTRTLRRQSAVIERGQSAESGTPTRSSHQGGRGGDQEAATKGHEVTRPSEVEPSEGGATDEGRQRSFRSKSVQVSEESSSCVAITTTTTTTRESTTEPATDEKLPTSAACRSPETNSKNKKNQCHHRRHHRRRHHRRQSTTSANQGQHLRVEQHAHAHQHRHRLCPHHQSLELDGGGRNGAPTDEQAANCSQDSIATRQRSPRVGDHEHASRRRHRHRRQSHGHAETRTTGGSDNHRGDHSKMGEHKTEHNLCRYRHSIATTPTSSNNHPTAPTNDNHHLEEPSSTNDLSRLIRCSSIAEESNQQSSPQIQTTLLAPIQVEFHDDDDEIAKEERKSVQIISASNHQSRTRDELTVRSNSATTPTLSPNASAFLSSSVRLSEQQQSRVERPSNSNEDYDYHHDYSTPQSARIDRSQSCAPTGTPTIVVNWSPGSGTVSAAAAGTTEPQAAQLAMDGGSLGLASSSEQTLLGCAQRKARDAALATTTTTRRKSSSKWSANTIVNQSTQSESQGSGLSLGFPQAVRKQSVMLLNSLTSRGSQTLRRLSMVAQNPMETLLRRSKSSEQPEKNIINSRQTDSINGPPSSPECPDRKRSKRTIDDYLMAVAGIDSSSSSAASESDNDGEDDLDTDSDLDYDDLDRQRRAKHSSAGSNLTSLLQKERIQLPCLQVAAQMRSPTRTTKQPNEQNKTLKVESNPRSNSCVIVICDHNQATDNKQTETREEGVEVEQNKLLRNKAPSDSILAINSGNLIRGQEVGHQEKATLSLCPLQRQGALYERATSRDYTKDVEEQETKSQTSNNSNSIMNPGAMVKKTLLTIDVSGINGTNQITTPSTTTTTTTTTTTANKPKQISLVSDLLRPTRIKKAVNVSPRRRAKRTSKWHAKRLRAETKAAKTVGIIVGGFIFCWLPFFTAYFWRAVVCYSPDCIPRWSLSLFIWLGYINSAINPVIYGLFSADFRQAFKNILCRCRFRNGPDGDSVVVSALVDNIIKSIL